MKIEKLISVLLPTYKEDTNIFYEALSSIINQSYSNLEILILMDFKDEDKIKIIKNMNDKRIKLIINDTNLGIVENLNNGLKLACGEYIARMDADDISINTRLAEQVEFLEKNNFGLVGCAIEPFDVNGSYNPIYYPQNTEDCYFSLNYFGCMAHPTWLGKKEVFLNLNGYRNILYTEDLDFLLRCRSESILIGNCDKVLLKYRLSNNSISRKFNIDQYILTNFLLEYYKKNLKMTYDSYKDFINSSHFEKKKKKYLKYLNSKKIFKILNLSIVWKKIKSKVFCEILNNKYYYKVYKKLFRRNLQKYIGNYDVKLEKADVFFLGSADYSNIGDLAISEATCQYIVSKGYTITEIPLHSFNLYKKQLSKFISKDSIIVLQGGGNLGIDYFEAEKNRRYVLKRYFKNKIYIFPCSIHYSKTFKGITEFKKSQKIYNRCKNLSILARDEKSLEIMKNAYKKCHVLYFPDIVLSYKSDIRYSIRKNVGVCLRNDSEKSNFIIDDFLEYETFDNVYYKNNIFPFEREKIVFEQLCKIAKYNCVITDRLHIMIFCYLTNTPCLAIDNSNHKIKNLFNKISSTNFIFMDLEITEFLEKIKHLVPSKGENKLPIIF